jgi:ketosteroid isomerase-like protein
MEREMRMDKEALLTQLYQDFNQGIYERMLNYFHNEILWREAIGTDQEVALRGLTQIKKHVIDQVSVHWEHFYITPIEFIQSKDKVVVTAIYDVQEKLSNKNFQTGAAHIWKFKDNKVIELQAYINNVSEVE